MASTWKLSIEECRQLAAMHQTMSMRRIAGDTGRDRKTIRRAFDRLGVTPRPGTGRKRIPSLEYNRIAALYEDARLSEREIVRTTGYARLTVQRVLARMAVAKRSKSEGVRIARQRQRQAVTETTH